MRSTDKKCLNKLAKHAAETRSFLSNKMKPERERAVCRAFLRSIGVSFSETELAAPTEEPVDVAFRMARFQIRDLLEPDRKRGDDWKDKEQKYSDACSIDELKEPDSPSIAFDLNKLVPEISGALLGKAQKYGLGCNDIDALVYVDLKDRHLEQSSEMQNLGPMISQGWRSVSFLFPPFGVVLFANSAAPEFLRDAASRPHARWEDVHTLFEQ
ncbi:MAG: DUF1780 domain-containing protein [Planctomycetota bacterium]